jgi:DNA (cytosine-5)-methyltransferase 1
VAVAFAQNQLGEVRTGEVTNTPNQNSNASGRNTPMVQASMYVRRLLPVECCRLQGFPDTYLSQVTFRGKCPPADGVMYKALGNSMAINCMSWIGQRIEMMEPFNKGVK